MIFAKNILALNFQLVKIICKRFSQKKGQKGKYCAHSCYCRPLQKYCLLLFLPWLPLAQLCSDTLWTPCYAGFGLVWTPMFFFIGEFLQKFNLKNVISINTKGFFMGKLVQIFQFSKKKKKFKIARFLQ